MGGSSFFDTSEVVAGGGEHLRGEQQHRDQVGQGHEAVEGVGDAPDELEAAHAADDGHADEAEAVVDAGACAEEVVDGAFAVVGPAEDGGEGEAADGQRDEHPAEPAETAGKGGDGELRAVPAEQVRARGEDGQRGDRAHDDRVEKDLEDPPHPLADGFLHVGGGIDDDRAAEPGLVGEDPARHAVADGVREDESHRAAPRGPQGERVG